MLSYLEWGICLVSICFCWWKYGWSNDELIKAGSGLLKKLDAILLHPQTVPSSHQSAKWNTTNFMNMPISRAHFSRKKVFPPLKEDDSDSSVSKDDLAFYKTYKGTSQFLGDVLPRYTVCTICDRNPKLGESKKDLGIQDTSGIKNCLSIDLRNPENPWYVRRFAFFIFFWRKWFIGPQYHMVQLEEMMTDERLLSAIKESARQELKENPGMCLDSLIKKHKQRAERVIINMRAKQAKIRYFAIYVRIAAWLIGKVLSVIYPKILVEKSQIEAIKKARATGNPIIYLPIHRSHLDYVLVSWTLVNMSIRAPLVAAGENLNIPVFSLMMKSVGGFFIKRRLDRKEGKKDILYRAILQLYMEKSFEFDNDMEFFIEGGRTRTGKPCHPKGGLLSIAVDTLVKQKVDDILIVPVNFSYEKLVEGNYVREQLGKTKTKESFASAALGLWTSLQTKYGNARVDYGAPFSMREYIMSYQSRRVESPSILSLPSQSDSSSENDSGRESLSRRSSFQDADLPELVISDQRELINSLAKHVIHDGVQCFTLMPSNALAFILLNKYRDGCTMDILVQEMEILKQEFHKRNHRVIFDGPDTKSVIEHGLDVLGPALVQKELVRTNSDPSKPTEILLRPVTEVPNVIDLSYYSTCILPIYALEAVAATSILTLVRDTVTPEEAEQVVILEADLITACSELCGILYHEFIFNPPCESLKETLRRTLRFMESENLIRYSKFAAKNQTDDEMLSINDSSHHLVHVSAESIARLTYLHRLIRPILDTYVASSFALKRLVGCEAQEKQLQMDMQAEVRCQIQQNVITYGESVALDPIRNFIKLLTSWQVLDSERRDGVTVYSLNEHFNDEKATGEVVRRIYKFHL